VKAHVKNRQSIRYTLLGAIIIALITFGVADAHGIKNQLNSWKLLPQPERLTELYYVNPNSLPSTYTPGVNQKFGFTVHNVEYRNTDYTYQIEEENQAGSQTVTLQQGSFWLSQNQYKTIDENVNLSDLGPRVQIVVNLSNVNESIDYWANRSNS
jgi:uncharacterized membrane protein